MSSNEIPSDYHLLFHDIKTGRAVTKKSQFKSRVGYVLTFFQKISKFSKNSKSLTYTHNYTKYHTNMYRVGRIGLAGACLGMFFGIHATCAIWILSGSGEFGGFWLQWCLYGCVLSFFHLMEFFTTAAFNPASATYDSYLINHSTAYTIAALVSWLEFWLKNFVGTTTGLNWSFPPAHISIGVGLAFTTFGQFARSLAMWTARSNFNHIVQDRKHKGHVLVTSGIYTFLRHPSYVGFFYWSIGTQILLGNPFCIVAYTVASWRFFNQRIPVEEEFLATRIFPNEYPRYMKRTFIGIPFIKSFAGVHVTTRG